MSFGGPITENSGADIWPGQLFRVMWSNGAGESIYRLVDNPASTAEIRAANMPAFLLELVRETEYGS